MQTSGELPGLSIKLSTAMQGGSNVLKKKLPHTFTGTIVYYDQAEKIGCIQYTNNNKKDLILFLLYTLEGTFTQQLAADDELKEGESVSFNIRNTNKGPLAINVQVT